MCFYTFVFQFWAPQHCCYGFARFTSRCCIYKQLLSSYQKMKTKFTFKQQALIAVTLVNNSSIHVRINTLSKLITNRWHWQH